MKRAKCAVAEGHFDAVSAYLKQAKHFAQEMDKLLQGGKFRFTCPLFENFENDWMADEAIYNDSMHFWEEQVRRSIFDPVRERKDFKMLFQ